MRDCVPELVPSVRSYVQSFFDGYARYLTPPCMDIELLRAHGIVRLASVLSWQLSSVSVRDPTTAMLPLWRRLLRAIAP